MIVTPSLILTRAKRRKKAIPNCVIASLEILQAVLSLAEHRKQECILTIDTNNPLFASENMIGVVRALLAESSICFGLILQVPADQKILEGFLMLQEPALQIMFNSSHSQEVRVEFISQLSTSSLIKGTELLAENSGKFSVEKSVQLVESGLHCIILPHLFSEIRPEKISLSEINNLTSSLKIPLISTDEDPAGYWAGKAAKAGIYGFTLDKVINQAYTAGLRAGLRNREHFHPADYALLGQKAVKKTLDHYLDIF